MARVDLSCGGWAFAPKPPPIKILVVDDDDEDVYLFKRLLGRSKRLAYEVVACRGLDEGAAIAAAEPIDVAFVDFFLGIGISIDSGRPHHDLLSLPFVMLSGLDVDDLEHVARDAGAIGFLCKGGLTVDAVDTIMLQALRASWDADGPAAARRAPVFG